MKTFVVVVASLLYIWPRKAIGDEISVPSIRIHPLSRRVKPRSGWDCGKLVMICSGAECACSNACYRINCVDQKFGNHDVRNKIDDLSSTDALSSYDAGRNNERNRKQSGWQTKHGSVCNKPPFSQKFHDPQERSLGDLMIEGDEGPMAAVIQDGFKDSAYRNNLRCIPKSQDQVCLQSSRKVLLKVEDWSCFPAFFSQSGGTQLSQFIRGAWNGQSPLKTCPGKIQDGDYWNVEFDLTSADAEYVYTYPRLADDVVSPPLTAQQAKLNIAKSPIHLTWTVSSFILQRNPTRMANSPFP